MFLASATASAPLARHILVVDDEPDILAGVTEILVEHVPRARVFTAASGKEALAVLRDHVVDLIVTDYKMPGMDGLELLEAAKDVAPGVPHILVTAFDKDVVRRLGPRASRQRILQKPFDPPVLLAAVCNALGP